MPQPKNPKEVAIIKEGGQRIGEVLTELEKMIKPGVSAWEIDQEAKKLISEAGGKPAFKGYQPRASDIPFPGTVCVCINDELVHGIPTKEKVIRAGDIVSLDIGMEWPGKSSEFSPTFQYGLRPQRRRVHSFPPWAGPRRLAVAELRVQQNTEHRTPNARGYFTDTALTVVVGEVPEKTRKLLAVTKQSLEVGIAQCHPGNSIADIGRAIEAYDKAQGNYGIVRDLVGHGVGHQPHEAPAVPNYYSRELESWKLEPGVVIAIEPMITLGGYAITTDPDRWTIRTKDRSLCAHFEHTVVITKGEPVVATRRPNE